jgi:hypothetical protein
MLLLLTATGLQTAVLWCAPVPLGVPGEWTWPRIRFSAETASGWALAVAIAGVYLAFVWAGGRRVERCRNGESAAWLAGLVITGFVWLMAVQAAVPGVAGLPKVHFVLYYPRSSGYFWQARYDVDTTKRFLAEYEQQMAEGEYLHIGTHPPGLTLCFRGLSALCSAVPILTDILLWSQPDSVRAAGDEIRTRTAATPNRYTAADVACVWLAAMLVQWAAAATVVPLFHLLRGAADRADAWYAAALWPLVPAVAVFLPKSDAMFPFLSTLTACVWWAGWRRQSIWRCGLAGLTMFTGLLFSLAFLPVLMLLAVWTVLAGFQRPDAGQATENGRRRTVCIAAAAAAFLVPLIVFYAAWDLNLLRVWQWNLSNHSQFYAHFHRTYWTWLLVNPVELYLAVGAPLGTLALIGIARCWRTPLRNSAVLAFLIVWSLLWVSGKNMGEAARLWLLLMPWLVLAAPAALAPAFDNGERPGVDNRTSRSALWVAAAALQSVACIATVTGVDGFHFDELLPQAVVVDGPAYPPTPYAARRSDGARPAAATSHRSRPACFARYSAASAAAISSLGVIPCCGQTATPALAVIRMTRPSKSTAFRRTVDRMSSATR